jgi:cyclopropane fatty-acyl-phospholipid synthase-like methyltransferase
VSSRVPVSEIVAYYEPKTQDLLRRYGPGPRLHYHTGIVDEPAPLNTSLPVLRDGIVAAQERMLRHAAAIWRAQSTLCGEVLDVGCGLGGGALFWAQEFGAQVTAVSCVPSQTEWVARFAKQAGIAAQVHPLLCDALEIPGENCFDAAVAVDSLCHIPRRALFERLATLLHRGGSVFVTDCFLVRPEYAELFNRHWHVRIGTMEEYRAAARQAGLREVLVEEISPRVEYFWAMTHALIEAEAYGKQLTPDETAKFAEALQAHALVRQGLNDGGYRYALMSFVKE